MTPSRNVFRGLFLLGVVLALALRLPGVATPFFADDLVQMGYLAGGDPGTYAFENELDLYRFYADDSAAVERKMARGDLPWRFEATQRCAFFRPVASALMALDHALFGTRAVPAHVHSLLWFTAFLALLHRLYLRLLPEGAARIATLAAAFSPATAIPVEWWSARNSLLAAVFGAGALLCYHRWCGTKALRFLAGGLALLALAWLSAESGVQVLGFVLAVSLIGTPGGLSARLRGAAPALALFLLYMIARSGLGYGVRDNALYVDPLGEPGVYLGHLVEKLVPTMAAATTGPGSSLGLFGAVVLGIAWILSRRSDGGERPSAATLVWLALGAALALFLCFGGRNSMRPWTLVIPQLGIHAILGWAIAKPWSVGRGGGVGTMVARGAACLLFVASVLLPARPFVEALRAPGGAQPTPGELAGQFPPEVRGAITSEVRTIVFLRAPVTVMPIDRLERWHAVDLPRRGELTTLVLSDRGAVPLERAGLRATRTGNATLSLASELPLVKGNDIFRFDDRVPLEEGTVAVGDVSIRIDETARGRPRSIRVELPDPLDDPGTLFLTWTGPAVPGRSPSGGRRGLSPGLTVVVSP